MEKVRQIQLIEHHILIKVVGIIVIKLFLVNLIYEISYELIFLNYFL